MFPDPFGVPLQDLLSAPRPTAPWVWEGYLAAGKVTLLTSLWKMGKTTLLSVLLAKMKAGGELAGRKVLPTRPLIVSEESPDYWAERGRRLPLAPDIRFLCQPFRCQPTLDEWNGLIDGVANKLEQNDIRLLVIDPLATFLPSDENNAKSMMRALLALQRLTSRGMAVLLLHHPRKRDSEPGHSARGSGALSGFADILLELRPYPEAGENDRRRRLCGLSRFAETPRQVAIELNEAGTDYAFLGDMADAVFAANWDVLKSVLMDADDRLTRKQICERWPVGEARPDEATLWRWLERAMVEYHVQRSGTGRRNGPFKYWLAEAEAHWKRDPFYLPLDPLLDEMTEQVPPHLPPEVRKLLEKERKNMGG